jgi:NAD(P)H-flavin reductase
MMPPFCEFLSEMTKHQKQPVKVTEVMQLTQDTKKIRLDFSNHLQVKDIDFLRVSGLACGKHINVFCDNPAFQRNRWNGMEQTDYEKGSITIKRSFTPVACGNGYMDLVVKIYKAKYGFSDGGRMTAHFVDELRVGDEISITGPHGQIEYLGLGKFSFSSTTTNFDKIGMVVGGSGITPMWQLIQTIHAEREMLPLQTSNLPSIHLIYGNKTRQDILLADYLANKDLFDKGTLSKTTHVLSQQKEDDGQENMCQKEVSFTFGRRIDLNILRKNLPKPSKSTLILLCGPDTMVDSIRKLLTSNQLQYQDENIQIF